MNIKSTEKEDAVLGRLAKSSDGKVLAGYIQKIIDVLSDIRTLRDGESKESRITAINLLESNLIDRFKVLSGSLEEEDNEQDFR